MKTQNNLLLVGSSFQEIGVDSVQVVYEIMKNIYDENGNPDTKKMSQIGQILNTEYQHIFKSNVMINGEKMTISTIICFKNKPSNTNIKKIVRKMTNGGHINVIGRTYQSCLKPQMVSDIIDKFFKINHVLDYSNKNFYEIL